VQASSLGFDGQLPQKLRSLEANGDSQRGDRPDYSNFAQQKRSSVELGMGNTSHAAITNPDQLACMIQEVLRGHWRNVCCVWLAWADM